MKRVNIGIFGRVNSGKSTLMNLITQQYFSIVDSTPGTTTDVKTTVMEIHDFSPVKIFDTAGIDEPGELGTKKRIKSLNILKRSDIVLLVINKNNSHYLNHDYQAELDILKMAQRRDKEIFIIYNLITSHTLQMKKNQGEHKVTPLQMKKKPGRTQGYAPTDENPGRTQGYAPTIRTLFVKEFK